ncbi:MAG: Uncharacterized MFS-type transporter [uncultured Rubrobacteraceae bacterium]|uniref:Uncharacterized MFS-type transporter n=1 Tax=uncultured Rubrobacteraceae bacterium TaxID=349277 RepID=A0A6J4R4L1_9ACTN|nr:MAG: Uncharacterized MFS-type transporter [uncultured Rubrobacteraceae bacterium]
MIEAALIILVPVVLYLPGHFLGGSLARKGDGWTESTLLRISCAIAVATPILVLLALMGWFRAPVLLACFAAATVVAWALARRGSQPVRRPFERWDLALYALVVASFSLYGNPAEYVLKDRDPGVYAVVAAKLARTGELLTRDPLVGAVSAFHEFADGAKHSGFFIQGDDLLVPQFFPGPFALLGLGNMVGGSWAGLYVVPVFGALAVGMAFLLGSELFGRWAGLVGAALLATSYTQVWWSRYPSSEVLTQFFILAGLWLAARFVRGGDATTGLMAGLLFGGAMLVRVDAFLAALAIPALVAYDLLLGRSLSRWAFVCVPPLILGGGALLYLWTVGGRYLNIIEDLHVPAGSLRLSVYALGASLLLAFLIWFARRWGRAGIEGLLEARGRSAALIAAAVVSGAALWAYFVMPEPWAGLPEYWGGREDPMAEFHAYDRQVVVRMVWFLTPAVALLGMAGFLLASYRLDRARALFLGAVLAFGVLYVAAPNVAPDLPWATRRFVPAVFPGVSLLAGYAAVEAGRALGRAWDARAGAALAAVLAAVALGWSAYVAWPVYGVRELAGAAEGIESLEDAVPPSRVIYVETPAEDYAATLDYLYGRPVLVYHRDQLQKELPKLREAGLLEDAAFVTVEEWPKPVFPGLKLRKVGEEKVSFLRLEDGFKEVPREAYVEQQGFKIFELEAG